MLKKFYFIIIGLGVLVAVALFISNYRYSFFPVQGGGWSVGYQELISPLEEWKPRRSQILTFEWLDEQTSKNTRFLADPFVVFENGEYFIFFEHQAEGNANIGLMRSRKTKDFAYEGEVLEEEFHLSFPQVFKYKDDFYMLPETRQTGHVLLYRAEEFPFSWKVQDTLIKNVSLQDPAILIEDPLFLISGREDDLTQYVYTADSLDGHWKKDNRFKPRKGDETRAGGNFFKFEDAWFIPFQKNTEGYGTGISLYELHIEEDKIEFKKKKDSFLVKSDSIKWFNKGMHHISVIKTSEKYFCVFDGDRKDPLNRRQVSWKASIKYNYYDLVNYLKQKI